MANAHIRIVLWPVLLLATFGTGVMSLFEAEWFYTFGGLACLLVVLTGPLLTPRFDWFSPWSMMVLAVFFGCTLRGVCMTTGWPEPDKVDMILIAGANVEDFYGPTFLMIASLLLTTIGYFGIGRRLAPKPFSGFLLPTTFRFRATIIGLIAISVAAAGLYITLTGGLDLSNLSSKRTRINDIDVAGDTELQQHGPVMLAAQLTYFGMLLVIGVPIISEKQRTPFWIALAFLSFLFAIFIPFYTSQRLPVAWAFVSIAALVTYSGKKFPVKKLAMVFAGCCVLYTTMSTLRLLSENADVENTGLSEFEELCSSVIVNRNFLGIAKNTHIVNSVPHLLPYENGATIGVWAFANVPRAVWPGKPLIHSGPIIGNVVYGNRICGVPPGYIAELYWNFGAVGMLAGGLFFGVFMRGMYELFNPNFGGQITNRLLYVAGPMKFTFDLTGNSIGYALNSLLLTTGIMVCLMLWLRVKRPRVIQTARIQTPHSPVARRAA